jgi:hypothetical protein
VTRPGVLSKDAGLRREKWVRITHVPDYITNNLSGEDKTDRLSHETLLVVEKGLDLSKDRYLVTIDSISEESTVSYEQIADDVRSRLAKTKADQRKQSQNSTAFEGDRPQYLRPNGEVYYGRTIDGRPDVEVLKEAVANGLVPYLYGEPGCGKTALVEAAFGEGLETIIGSSDTDESSFVGSWVQDADGYKWVDGPLVRAMKNGTPIFIDEVGLIDARVISILNPLLDGRGVLEVRQNPTLETVHAKEGFACLFAGNPNALGVRMSEALLSRLSYPLLVETDFDILTDIGVHPQVAQIVKSLNERKRAGESAWAPQTREALAVTKIWNLFGEKQGVDSLVSLCPAYSRNQVLLAIQAFAGIDAGVLQVDAQ